MSRVGLLLLFISVHAFGQISPEKRAAGRMERGKWQKTELTLRKAMARDSLNVEARYVMSIYYFKSNNPSFDLDSAYEYVHRAMTAYKSIPPRDRDKLKKIPIDSSRLSSLERKIDSASFEKAKDLNSESGYQYFINRHPTAPEIVAAIELRDEVAFLEALKINTWSAYRHFMTRYPESHRLKDAQERFDKLLFEDKTKEKRLLSFIRFVQQFPESPYRAVCEQNIFEIATASGSSASFKWFAQEYPASPWVKRAKDILYALQTPDDGNVFDPSWMTDSLRNAAVLLKSYWVPIYKAGRFGFMDESGNERMSPRFSGIADEYRCGDVTDPFLITSVGLIARNGVVLWPARLREAKDLGSGFIKLALDSGSYVIHESGFGIGSTVCQDAQVIAGRLLALKKKGKWCLQTLSGRALTAFQYDQVTAVDSIVIMIKGGKKVLTTPGRIGKVADRTELREEFVFDDIRHWGNQQYWVRNGMLEGVMDANLKFVIPLDRQILQRTNFGFLQKKNELFFLKGIKSLENTPYEHVQEQGGWIRLQTKNNRHQMYDKALKSLTEGDSAWFQGQLAFVRTSDSVKTFLPSGQRLTFSRKSIFYFKEYLDSAAWLVLEEKKSKLVYDAVSGIRLFAMEFDQMEALTPNILLMTRQGKKGLITGEGRILVPIEYDAIVRSGHNSFSLLKEKKFGWYDAGNNSLIKPLFDRNIREYNARLRIAYREKGYGFIQQDGTPSNGFEGDDIQYWNDTLAWVKKNTQWELWDVNEGRVKLERVKNFSPIADSPSEKIYLVRQDNAFGVISNRRGVIVPLQYSDIVNLGTKERPLYFTERHIEEAGISVVIYYDRNGKVIRKQAMEADEFDRIYCDN